MAYEAEGWRARCLAALGCRLQDLCFISIDAVYAVLLDFMRPTYYIIV